MTATSENGLLIRLYQNMIKISYIKELDNGQYMVCSKKGKNLGTYKSRSAAEKRLAEVEMFKHMDKKKKRRMRRKAMLEIINLKF